MSAVEASSPKSSDLPPFKEFKQKPPKINFEARSDGSFIIQSAYALADMPASMIHVFKERVSEHPERDFLCQRDLSGAWEAISYGEMDDQSDRVAAALLARGLGQEDTLMVISGNSIAHAVLMMGAHKAQVPIAPVSIAYSLLSQDFAKLRHVVETAQPKVVFAEQGGLYARALSAIAMPGIEIIVGDGTVDGVDTTLLSDLLATAPSEAVATSISELTEDTIAKYLFTSGSTGMPKGVVQTHGMIAAVVAGQNALRTDEDDEDEIPKSLEWMPWSHISAGNISFNGNIWVGGTQYLDAGKPIPGMFDATIQNLKEISPRVFGSAPIAFVMLADAMERDPALRKNFFKKLEFMGYGGATLSDDIYDRMQALAIEETGQRIPFTTMYGATETQGITVVHWITDRVGLIGLPLPGITLKLVPNGTKLEVRVKGPTVTPGYLNRPDLTSKAFDDEGFYALGDAAKFVDPGRPEAGLVFDGRVTEDFKLSTGTWVSVGTLRAEINAAASPVLNDCVVVGQDKDYISVLAWPNFEACKAVATGGGETPQDLVRDPGVAGHIKAGLGKHNQAASSSRRIKRLLLMVEPPSIDGHEITDKGYINQRATLERRADLAARLYDPDPAPDIVELG